jgi:hypothetical protein
MGGRQRTTLFMTKEKVQKESSTSREERSKRKEK